MTWERFSAYYWSALFGALFGNALYQGWLPALAGALLGLWARYREFHPKPCKHPLEEKYAVPLPGQMHLGCRKCNFTWESHPGCSEELMYLAYYIWMEVPHEYRRRY